MHESMYIQLNDRIKGIGYPEIEPFVTWMHFNDNVTDDWVYYFDNDLWVQEQKLCVQIFPIDISLTFYITCTRSWIEHVCPILLTNSTYNQKYLCTPDTTGKVYGVYSHILPFLPYSIDNIGIHYPNMY